MNIEIDDNQPLAGKLFDIMPYHDGLKCQLDDAVLDVIHPGWRTSKDPTPVHDWFYDDYDQSVEFRGCLVGWRPTKAQCAALGKLGFKIAWFRSHVREDGMVEDFSMGLSSPRTGKEGHCRLEAPRYGET